MNRVFSNKFDSVKNDMCHCVLDTVANKSEIKRDADSSLGIATEYLLQREMRKKATTKIE